MKHFFGHVIPCVALVGAASTVAAAPSSIDRAGIVASTDDERGVPTFVWASPTRQPVPSAAKRATPQEAARWYLEQYAPLYGLSAPSLSTAAVSHVHDTGRGGVIVRFEQTVDGVPVARTRLNVLMKRGSYQLVALTGNLHHAAVSGTSRAVRTFKLRQDQALARALEDVFKLEVSPGDMRATGLAKAGYAYYDMVPTGKIADAKLALAAPARIKQVLFPVGDQLVPAYYAEVSTGHKGTRTPEDDGFFIAADDGRILERRSLIDEDAYTYTVWADGDNLFTPIDGPHSDFTPHPAGFPDGSRPDFISPIQVVMEGFNTNPTGVADPWLPAGATETVGNNVDAYTDHIAPDGFTPGVDIRADVTGPSEFGHVYDTAVAPLEDQTQMKAAVTQLFYVTNWLHDYFYDSGFDEAAGNAQADNLGRGGIAGDHLRAEAQDGALAGSRNNANMSTPADGASPRMQMFLWTGPDIRSLSALGQTLTSGAASFGPLNFDVVLDLALADDGVSAPNGGTPTDGCEALVNPAEVAGKIALIDRGACSFALKAQNAELAGAAGVLVANNVPGGTVINMANQNPPLTIGIPALMVTFEDGAALRAELGENPPVSVAMSRVVEVERDGTIDNQIIAHEWGHYIHRRLVSCGNAQCGAMSEGWGDIIALFMSIREGDDVNGGAFGVGIYGPAALHESAYFGIRRAAYSLDPAKNSLSFRHIANGEPLPADMPLSGVFANNPNAEIHNAGELWTSMWFEAYAAMINETTGPQPRYTFAEAQRRMADYIVAGLKLTPVNATFTEGRDGILAAAAASDIADAQLIADAFAKRGAGTCAESPARQSTDFVGVSETFANSPNMKLVGVTLDDAVRSCDNDGFLDGDERGQLRVEVQNTGLAPLVETKIVVSSPTEGVTFPDGPNVVMGAVAPFEVGVGTLAVALDAAAEGAQDIQLDIVVLNGETCVLTTETVLLARGNFDVIPDASATESVESPITVWAETSVNGAAGVWSRAEDEASAVENHLWHGIDGSFLADTSLESPPMAVAADADFSITLAHRYSFEFDATTDYDGGVIEISRDGGATWEDVTSFGADPGYNAALTDDNPLGARPSFGRVSPSFPQNLTATLDFGTQLAGETVMLRFRIGSDPFVGAPGWFIDDIQVAGITNTPFPIVADDQGECRGIPSAVAGPDQIVDGGELVTLDASESSDPDNDPIAFAWEQVDGPAVALEGGDQAVATFVAPELDEDTDLLFQVTATDGDGSTMDQVLITVRATPVGPGPDGGPGDDPGDDIGDGDEIGGCGCQTGGGPAGNAGMLLLLGAALAIVRGRRRSR